jgi:large subunit ribosomal protein L9
VTAMAMSNFMNFFELQTTFVLKRRTNVPLYKKNQSATKLRGRHFNYELIEDQNIKKQPNVDIILTSYVAGIGRKGEVVNVSPSIAYNQLLLPGLATYVTPENVEKYSKLTAENTDDEDKHSSQFAQRVS